MTTSWRSLYEMNMTTYWQALGNQRSWTYLLPRWTIYLDPPLKYHTRIGKNVLASFTLLYNEYLDFSARYVVNKFWWWVFIFAFRFWVIHIGLSIVWIARLPWKCILRRLLVRVSLFLFAYNGHVFKFSIENQTILDAHRGSKDEDCENVASCKWMNKSKSTAKFELLLAIVWNSEWDHDEFFIHLPKFLSKLLLSCIKGVVFTHKRRPG